MIWFTTTLKKLLNTLCSLYLARLDISIRKIEKSKLAEIIISDNNNSMRNEKVSDKCMSVHDLDMMTQIRSCINNVTDFFQQFTGSFLFWVPKNYIEVDLVADTYRSISINQRNEITESHLQRYFGSVKGKIEKYLSNDKNKTQLIQLIFIYLAKLKGFFSKICNRNHLLVGTIHIHY